MTTIHCEEPGCSASFECDEFTFGVEMEKSFEGWVFLRCAPGEPGIGCPDHSGELEVDDTRPYWLKPDEWEADKARRERMRVAWENTKAGTA